MSFKQTTLSKEFINKLAELSAGDIPMDVLDIFIDLIEKELKLHYFTYSSESNLHRIITAMFDKISFINESIKYPHYIEILLLVSVNSNYLTDILVRNPEYFYYIVNPSNLKQKSDPNTFRIEIRDSIRQFASFNAKVNAFRRIKRKETLRIGLMDLLKLLNLQEITFELSILAKTIIEELFELCYLEILKKYKVDNISNRYCITALGKLGGNELNYSSDVDLIIFFDENKTVNDKEFYEILTEAIYLFIENSSSHTSSGYIYRVDLRLRPDGRNSPLCRTLSDYLIYYESRGDDWERQMLIKASFSGGSKDLFNKFINYLQPFVYPLSFSISPKEQISRLKSNIEKNITSDDNIKLSPGGIRDIEFSVQAIQLLNGGGIKEIRTGNTLDAIKQLSNRNLLGKEESIIFNNAYLFFRNVEHYLQLMNDKQTHLVPESGELVDKLGFYLNYKSTNEFRRDLLRIRSEVKRLYSSIMGLKDDNEKSILKKIHFENIKNAESNLLFLREGKSVLGIRQFDKNSIDLFQNLQSRLIKYLESSTRPDKVLQNFVRIIKDVPFPSQWYREFTNKDFFNSFLIICEFDQKTIDLFAEDDELREYFISKKIFERVNVDNSSHYSIKKLLFILSAQFILGKISSINFGKILQANIINKITAMSEEVISSQTEYFIAGLGSFGTGEMNFSSDIDLIFIVNDETRLTDIQKPFQNLLLKLKKNLQPFDTDCRLRPEGKSSQLVWDLKSYQQYLLNRARVWELQSLCKLKFITGNKKLFNNFTNGIIERLSRENIDNLKKEVISMRKNLLPSGAMDKMNIINIKKVKGGLLDIEFSVQYMILSNPDLFKQISRIDAEKRIQQLLPNGNDIKKNYIFLKKLVLRNQCIFSRSGYLFNKDEKENTLYKNDLQSILRTNNNLFNKLVSD